MSDMISQPASHMILTPGCLPRSPHSSSCLPAATKQEAASQERHKYVTNVYNLQTKWG